MKGETGQETFVVRSSYDLFPSKRRIDKFGQEDLPKIASDLFLPESVDRQISTTTQGFVWSSLSP